MKIALKTGCLWIVLAQMALAQKDVPRPLRDWLQQDARKNADGLKPQKERLPPLRRIADPKNLESKNPAIKAAAEIKQQEDLKCQKVKALRYLASVGCGCYNEDGKITEALLASLTDCTEEVRLATVEVIQVTASGGPCQYCNQKKCCSEDVVKKLAEMAYELDDKGCPIEPSARVRAAAVKAMHSCCPNQCPPMVEVPTAPPVEAPDTLPGIESVPLKDGDKKKPTDPQRTLQPEAGASSTTTEYDPPIEAPAGDSNWRKATGLVRPISQPGVPGASGSRVTTANVEGVSHVVSNGNCQGRIEEVLAPQEAVIIVFDNGSPASAERLVVYHRHALGRISASVELNIISVDGMKVVARPVAGAAALAKVSAGDIVVAVQ